MEKSSNMAELAAFVRDLRDAKKGCPWIIEQTFKSLAPLTIEESYEFAASAADADIEAMKDELADLLLHIILYAQLATEQNQFNLEDLAARALAKQKRRKMQFPDPSKATAADALKHWEANKFKERQMLNKDQSVLDGIAKTLPAINRAHKLQLQAAQVGFDWQDVPPIFAKLDEETQELKTALAKGTSDEVTEELGDLLFAMLNLARHLNIRADMALQAANQKFERRFRRLEKNAKTRGLNLKQLALDELEQLWQEVKKQT